MSLKIGGLFFGYGGLDLAVSSVLDAELAWVSEIDKGACKVIEHRFPGVPNIGDITTVDWSQVEPVDILTGGSPCQDLSHAGKRAGMTEGTRSNLWVAMREAIAMLRPSLVVWENVRGAFSAAADSAVEPCPGCVGDGSTTHLRALGRVLGDLSDLGYDAQWHGLRAADVGAPHGRFRVFVAAHPKGDTGRIFNGDGGAAADARGVPQREHGRGPARLVRRPDAAERRNAAADHDDAGRQCQWRKPAHDGDPRNDPHRRDGSPAGALGPVRRRDCPLGDADPTGPAAHRARPQGIAAPVRRVLRVDDGPARRMDHRRPRHHPQRSAQGVRQRRRTPAGCGGTQVDAGSR